MIEGHFKAADAQIELYERRMICGDQAMANVVLLHGYGDHCSRYEWVMEKF